jgi:hypothetical protein
MALKRDGDGHHRISFKRDVLLVLPFLHGVLATDVVVGFASADAATKKKARPVKFLTPLSTGVHGIHQLPPSFVTPSPALRCTPRC